jgi:hypothetical protein
LDDPELDADRSRDDRDAQRGRLEQARGEHLAAPLGQGRVEQRRHGPDDEQPDQEDWHLRERDRALDHTTHPCPVVS